MQTFTQVIQELSEYEEMSKAIRLGSGLVSITGCIDAQKPHFMYSVGREKKRRLIVTFHEQKAKELYEDYRFFDDKVVYYPARTCYSTSRTSEEMC